MKFDKHLLVVVIIHIIALTASFFLGEPYTSAMDYIVMILLLGFAPQITRNEEKIKKLESEIKILKEYGNSK